MQWQKSMNSIDALQKSFTSYSCDSANSQGKIKDDTTPAERHPSRVFTQLCCGGFPLCFPAFLDALQMGTGVLWGLPLSWVCVWQVSVVEERTPGMAPVSSFALTVLCLSAQAFCCIFSPPSQERRCRVSGFRVPRCQLGGLRP